MNVAKNGKKRDALGIALARDRSPIPGCAPVDLPRERLARDGVEALKDFELLAIVLGTGYSGYTVIEVAQRILSQHPAEHLMQMSFEGVCKLKGLGKAKAALLIAAFELARRGLGQGLGLLPTITHPLEAVALLTEIKDQLKEFFMCLYLNARNQVNGVST